MTWDDTTPQSIDALARDLKGRIASEVRFGDGDRGLYATDASNYRQVPTGVVIPRGLDDVVETLAACARHGAALTHRGGGTSLAGQTCNAAVVMDWSKYVNRILDLDPAAKTAVVEPGLVLDKLRDAAEAHGLTFGPDPATHSHNTLGGMIGNNSCGVHSVPWGRTVDNVDWLEVLTYDGLRLRVGPTSEDELEAIIAQGGRRGDLYAGMKAIRDDYAEALRQCTPHIKRLVSGYSLYQLLPENGFNLARALVGSEGTLATVLKAGLRLVDSPPVRALVVMGFKDVYEAGDHAHQMLPLLPLAVEGLDDALVDYMCKKGLNTDYLHLLPQGKGWLVVEVGGATREEAEAQGRRVMEAFPHKPARLYAGKREQTAIWLIRESGLGATANVPGEPLTWPGWEDSAVPVHRLGDYLRDFRKLLESYGYDCSFYGHFGDGLLHVRIDFDLLTAGGIAKWRRFLDDAAELVIGYDGSYSGEHGDGQARAELLGRLYGPDMMQAFRRFKGLWDPLNRMNPGKVIDPYPIVTNLRLGPDFRPPRKDTAFAYRQDQGDFNRAALCRRGQMPARQRRGHHVPQLHGDARGKALHPGPGAAAVRDGAWRPGAGRLAVRGGAGGAGFMPVLQGLQEGLPGECGHGHLQGRIHAALL